MANLVTSLLILPLSLLALCQWTCAEVRQMEPHGSPLVASDNSGSSSGSSSLHKRSLSDSNRMALANLLRRRRSFEESLKAPPKTYSRLMEDLLQQELSAQLTSGQAAPRMAKREDEWIWMPAHGYIPMPKDDSSNRGGSQDNGIGNLLRYG